MRILTEASGSLASAYLINSVRNAGFYSVASDIDEQCAGRYLADDFIHMPAVSDSNLWEITTLHLVDKNIDMVIPSLDECLGGWAERKELFRQKGVYVVISDPASIRICQDKWLTYNFFVDNGIPTPKTSLKQSYLLIKPRNGRGGKGLSVTDQSVSMDGMISQELLQGQEYTVDVFCDKYSNPVYIIPRQRIAVRDGKSTGGIVAEHYEIIEWVKRICAAIRFQGPVNIQCFDCGKEGIKFTEINPRVAGGMALGFAASENWVNIIVNHFIYGHEICPVPVKWGLQMRRYYAEIFIPPN